jgi:hypothetical protein
LSKKLLLKVLETNDITSLSSTYYLKVCKKLPNPNLRQCFFSALSIFCGGKGIYLIFFYLSTIRFVRQSWSRGLKLTKPLKVKYVTSGCFCKVVIIVIQSNSVITSSTGPSILVRYYRDNVMTVKLYVVKAPFVTKIFWKFSRLLPWFRYNRDRCNRVRLYVEHWLLMYKIVIIKLYFSSHSNPLLVVPFPLSVRAWQTIKAIEKG